MKRLGWDALDVILVTGDSYIDSPFIGTAVIGKLLARAGYRVGVIAQPDVNGVEEIGRLGKPSLFWGVTAGSIDSMVANYTAMKKKRKSDDYTPGGVNNRRPDRTTIVYTNLIRRWVKGQPPAAGGIEAPVVLGGIEASLRRLSHYDFWTDRVRRSVLLDAKADYLLYGMAEAAVLELAACLRSGSFPPGSDPPGQEPAGPGPGAIRGLCYLAKSPPEGYQIVPSYETVAQDKPAFIDFFHAFYQNNDPKTACGLAQQHGERWVVQNPPAPYSSQEDLDSIYALDFERAQHPYYEKMGPVKALETIRFSIATHRGCYGECSFCAIAVHEGRTVRWRSPESIVAEAEKLAGTPGFKGYIHDLGGPTANMYGFECKKKLSSGPCPKKRCLYPTVCPVLKPDHQPHLDVLRRVRSIPGVKKVFVASGIRYDLLLADEKSGERYLRDVVENHVSGQMKVAPEHTEDRVLNAMGKPGAERLLRFKALFERLTRAAGKPQFLTYYMIAAHPGCTEQDMLRLRRFAGQELGIHPEQVQIFTPTPSTYASLMYYTEMDPFTRQTIFVEKDASRKQRQKDIVTQ